MNETELKKQCPFCSEEISPTAKKCKHCGEWLEDKPDEIENLTTEKKLEDGEEPIGLWGRIIASIVIGGVGWALFYFGSWSLVLGKKINIFLQYLSTGQLKQQSFILESSGFVFRINENYYGFIRNERFFDSPLIQWIMLILSIGVFILAIQILLTGDFGSDD